MTTYPCPNLKSLAAGRYRITHEAPLDQQPTRGATADPWLAMIPTRTGHIYPWGPDTLAVFVEGYRKGLVERLVAAGCSLRTEGADGRTLLFPVALFSQVAELAGARKRRHGSPEAARRGAEALARFRAQHNAQSDFQGPVCPASPEVDLGAVQAEPAAVG